MTPSREDFARWRDDPVTRWVLKALEADAEAQKAAWMSHSWDNGHANPQTLLEFRTRADAYRAMREADYAAYCEALGDTPRDE